MNRETAIGKAATGAQVAPRLLALGAGKQAVLVVAPLLLFFVSLFVGRFLIHPLDVLALLASKLLPFLPIERTWTDQVEVVVLTIRLPRAIMAMMVGAGLSIGGAAYQGMFQNPLVSPYLLGVSAGAGFGAVLAILLDGGPATIQLMAFALGLVAVALTYSISRVYRTSPILMLVLTGTVISALFQAMISLITYITPDTDKLPAMVFWLMGSLSRSKLETLPGTVPIMAAGIAGLLMVRWRINILSMGDREARAMGVNTEQLKAIIILCTTVVVACAVSVCGVVGWVGLVVPHICRMWVGPDHKILLPASLSVGAAYLLTIDDVARTLTPAEIPLGILTAIIGAPFFIFLLRRSKGGWT